MGQDRRGQRPGRRRRASQVRHPLPDDRALDRGAPGAGSDAQAHTTRDGGKLSRGFVATSSSDGIANTTLNNEPEAVQEDLAIFAKLGNEERGTTHAF